MTALSYAIDATPLVRTRTVSIQRYARAAGVLMVLTLIFGYLGEMYIPSMFMSADTATTTQRIAASMPLYRFGFFAYLIEGLCDVALALLFYVLLKPVSKPLALAAAFFGLVSTALYAVGEVFYFIPTIWVRGPEFMHSFSPAQLNALTVLSLRVFGRVGWIFLAFYGIATFLRGWLIYRSGFLPKAIGALLMLGGLGFIARNVTFVLAPTYSSTVLLAPMAVAGLCLTFWMLARGVDAAAWEARAAGAREI